MSGLLTLGAGRPRPLVVASGFVPTTQSGLQAWYRTDDLALADAALIASFTDSSGNSNTATESTDLNKPVNKTNIVNGHAIARADGSNSRLLLTTGIALTGDFTFFWCWKVSDLAASRTYWSNSNSTPLLRQSTSTTILLRNDASSTATITHTAILNSAFYIVVMIRSGSTITRYVNGSSDGTATLSGTFTMNRLMMRSTNVDPMQGDMAETGVYNVDIGSTVRGQLEGYLNTRYAIF